MSLAPTQNLASGVASRKDRLTRRQDRVGSIGLIEELGRNNIGQNAAKEITNRYSGVLPATSIFAVIVTMTFTK